MKMCEPLEPPSAMGGIWTNRAAAVNDIKRRLSRLSKTNEKSNCQSFQKQPFAMCARKRFLKLA